jgi:hypothetical protein
LNFDFSTLSFHVPTRSLSASATRGKPPGAQAGTYFFTAEVLTLHGLVTYHVLFFIRLESRQADIDGITMSAPCGGR